MMRFYTTSCCILWVASFTFAQSNQSFQNVERVKLRNIGTIITGNEVKGYFTFYKVSKAGGGINTYLLRILDPDLKEIASETLNEDKRIQLSEAAFDGESLMIKFVDFRKALSKLYFYDPSGKLKNTKTLPLSKYDVETLTANANAAEIDNVTLQGVPEQGFFNYSLEKHKKEGYAVSHFTSAGENDWTYYSDPASKEVQTVDYLNTGNHLLLNVVSKRPTRSSNDITQYLSGIDLATGKAVFEKKLEDNQFLYQAFSGYQNPEDSSMVIFGLFYEKDAKMAKAQSLGLFSSVLDNEGNLISKKYISWTKDVSRFLPINDKGKIEKIGYMYFHNVFTTADKKIYAVAETYKKVASAAGIATRILSVGAMVGGYNNGGGMSTNKIVVEDLVVFEFQPGFNLSNVKVFDKSKTDVELPLGYGTLSPQALASTVKIFGGFDYAFTQINQERSNFIIGYTDVDREEKKRRVNFEAIIRKENSFATDKISLQTEATFLRVMPAKPGYVMLAEYFRKKKLLNFTLEKINY
jgi:hypothetical protein